MLARLRVIKRKGVLGQPKGSKNKKRTIISSSSDVYSGHGVGAMNSSKEHENKMASLATDHMVGILSEVTITKIDSCSLPQGLHNENKIVESGENQHAIVDAAEDGTRKVVKKKRCRGRVKNSENMKQAAVRRGRPKGLKNKRMAGEIATVTNVVNLSIKRKNGRGRPKGSKNKKAKIMSEENNKTAGALVVYDDGGGSQAEQKVKHCGMLPVATENGGISGESVLLDALGGGVSKRKVSSGRPKGSKNKKKAVTFDMGFPCQVSCQNAVSKIVKRRGRPKRLNDKKKIPIVSDCMGEQELSANAETSGLTGQGVLDAIGWKDQQNFSCHQCRNIKASVVTCSKCRRKHYCDDCIAKWYPDRTNDEVEDTCPHSPPLFVPHNFFIRGFLQNPNSGHTTNPNYSSPPAPSGFSQYHHASPLGFGSVGENMGNLGIFGANAKASNSNNEFDHNLIFGSLRSHIQGNVSMMNDRFSDDLASKVGNFEQKNHESRLANVRMLNGVEGKLENVIGSGRKQLGNLRGLEQQNSGGGGGESESESGGLGWGRQFHSGTVRGVVPPPGFSSKPRSRDFEHNVDNEKNNFVELNHRGIGLNHKYERESKHLSRNGKNYAIGSDDQRVFRRLDSPVPPAGSKLHSVLASDVEDSPLELRGEDAESGEETVSVMRDVLGRSSAQGQSELDELGEHVISSLGLEDEPNERSDKKNHHASRDKDYRSDKRGAYILGQRMRMLKRQIACRSDINRMNGAFLATFQSLIPPEEERTKQKQLLALLDGIVSKEWPNARLYVYGSCANSFGFSKSDIDICLAIEDANIDKSEVLLKLADMLQSGNLQNVQALTRARVPIVKLMDPETGISCDICVNNVLAVVNTKLLRDYAQIDVRLRQLAFIVKHWAKSRGVNETYQGTLSSYAYVLMCIHFLQQRRPAILPCLQGMEATYSVTVGNIECAYFDKVEKLYGFGSQNGESLARLVWAFFSYWAYCHDYANDVISIRSGSTVSKRAKDWTRRIGNDRHLICIEDPFEVSHDLGRVVDKFSIRVLREEFERAAEIMQYDPNPCVKLFEPYIPS